MVAPASPVVEDVNPVDDEVSVSVSNDDRCAKFNENSDDEDDFGQ